MIDYNFTVKSDTPSTVNTLASGGTLNAGEVNRLTGAGTITVPTTGEADIAIVNASGGDMTIGSVGDLADGQSCVLYWSGSAYTELTNVLS